MRKLLKKDAFVPERMITDELRSYAPRRASPGSKIAMSAVDEKQPRRELASANSEKRAQDARLQESGLGAEISFHSRGDLRQLQRPASSLDEADAQSLRSAAMNTLRDAIIAV